MERLHLLDQSVISFGGTNVVRAVTLQPFEYDLSERYRHKFMVQSIIIPAAATQQDIDSQVRLACINRHVDVFFSPRLKESLQFISKYFVTSGCNWEYLYR